MNNTAGETSAEIGIEIERPRKHHDAHQPPENAHSHALEPPREVIMRGIQKLGILDGFSKWFELRIAHRVIPIRLRQAPTPTIAAVHNVVRNAWPCNGTVL
jgi:hypothetical protein